MKRLAPLLLLLPAVSVSPGCTVIALSVASTYFDEPTPELTRHYAVDMDTAYAACWAGLTARGYPAPADPQPPERGVAIIRVHDVTVHVSRLNVDLTRVQATLGGFSNDEVRHHTELFLRDLDRILE